MNHPVKVMRIIARLNIGGPAIHVVLLAEKMGLPEFDNMLVTGHISQQEGDMAFLAEQHGIAPVYVKELGREISLWRDFITLWKLMHLMRKFRPDIVHTHTAKAGLVGRLAAWLTGIPVRVHTFHGHVFHGYFGKWKTRLFLWLERLAARISSRIITISSGLKDELVNTYHITSTDKCVVVPLGLDLRPFVETQPSPDFHQRHHISSDVKLVGIVGRLVPIKNHAVFLQAARHVLDEREDVHFLLIGDGETRPQLEAQVAQLDLQDKVTFTGWVQDVEGIMAELDVLALTSDNEGTPTAIIQAMAAGVPVVSTRVGGVSDVLENGEFGAMVPPGQPQAFAEALLQVLQGNHADLAQARESALQRYDVVHLVENLRSLYHTLLAEKRDR